MVKRWFHRVPIERDASGCTFEEWIPQTPKPKKGEALPAPITLLVNSSKVRAVFGETVFREVRPPALEAKGRRGRSAAVVQVEGLGPTTFVLDAVKDSDYRDVCLQAGSIFG